MLSQMQYSCDWVSDVRAVTHELSQDVDAIQIHHSAQWPIFLTFVEIDLKKQPTWGGFIRSHYMMWMVHRPDDAETSGTSNSWLS